MSSNTVNQRINFASTKNPLEYPDFLEVQLKSLYNRSLSRANCSSVSASPLNGRDRRNPRQGCCPADSLVVPGRPGFPRPFTRVLRRWLKEARIRVRLLLILPPVPAVERCSLRPHCPHSVSGMKQSAVHSPRFPALHNTAPPETGRRILRAGAYQQYVTEPSRRT